MHVPVYVSYYFFLFSIQFSKFYNSCVEVMQIFNEPLLFWVLHLGSACRFVS